MPSCLVQSTEFEQSLGMPDPWTSIAEHDGTATGRHGRLVLGHDDIPRPRYGGSNTQHSSPKLSLKWCAKAAAEQRILTRTPGQCWKTTLTHMDADSSSLLSRSRVGHEKDRIIRRSCA